MLGKYMSLGQIRKRFKEGTATKRMKFIIKECPVVKGFSDNLEIYIRDEQ